MSSGGDYVLNEDVRPGKGRSIAARGLTPNDIGRTIEDSFGRARLVKFSHRSYDTLVDVVRENDGVPNQRSYPHLFVLTVED